MNSTSAKMMQDRRVKSFRKEIKGFKYSDKKENKNGRTTNDCNSKAE